MTSPITRVPPPRTLAARGAGLSHTGCLRETNEDAILTDPSGALWAVADGMGGYGHGDIAADIVIDHLARLAGGATGGTVAGALAQANAAVRARARSEGFRAMGATVVAALVKGGRATVAWAGDSRAYLLRDGRLEALTRDHSLVADLVARGRLAPDQASMHPDRHVVTRAVGAEDRLEVERVEVGLRPGDRLMLCSDGLTGCLGEGEIAALLHADPEAACRRLVGAALEAGAPDNVSVVVVVIGEAGQP